MLSNLDLEHHISDKFEFTYHKDQINTLSFNNQGTLLISGGNDQKINVLDLKQLKLVFTISENHNNIKSVNFHPFLNYFVSAGSDSTIRFYNSETMTLEHTVVTNHGKKDVEEHPHH